jgi:hypothetical protein
MCVRQRLQQLMLLLFLSIADADAHVWTVRVFNAIACKGPCAWGSSTANHQ